MPLSASRRTVADAGVDLTSRVVPSTSPGRHRGRTEEQRHAGRPHAHADHSTGRRFTIGYVPAMARFDGRVALVSGAASGIGAAVADRFEPTKAQPWCAVRYRAHIGRGRLRCDATPSRARRRLRTRSANTVGWTFWSTSPASARPSLIGELTPDHWREIIDINLTGTFLLSHRRFPPCSRHGGSIVNMASVAGLRATPYNAAYCASKGGVIMLTKSMAIELAKAGVRVNAVCPASVDTPFLRNFTLPEGADINLLARAASPDGTVDRPGRGGRGRRLPGLGRCRHRQRAPPWSSTGPLRPDRLSATVSVSRPGAEDPARALGSVTTPSLTTSTPADHDVLHARRSGDQTPATAGKVVDQSQPARCPPSPGSNTTRSACHPSAIRPRSRNP